MDGAVFGVRKGGVAAMAGIAAGQRIAAINNQVRAMGVSTRLTVSDFAPLQRVGNRDEILRALTDLQDADTSCAVQIDVLDSSNQ